MESDFGNLEGKTNNAISLLTGQIITEEKSLAASLLKKASYKAFKIIKEKQKKVS